MVLDGGNYPAALIDSAADDCAIENTGPVPNGTWHSTGYPF
jgi:hypothetical protein